MEVFKGNENIFDISDGPSFKRLQIVGNLPFGIASPLLISMLESISKGKLHSIPEIEFILMFQKEVAEVSIIWTTYYTALENSSPTRQ